MPINEANRKSRDRWPLAFDLEGVPHETAERERLLLDLKALETSQQEQETVMPPVTNTFAVDYQQANTVVDINNPPQERYQHQEFPKMVYHHDSGHVLTVADDKELKAAVKRGFKLKPAPDRDYSQLKTGKIASHKAVTSREEELSAADMVDEEEVDENDEES